MDSHSLLHLAGDSWLLPGPTNIGVYADGPSAFLVDSGNDKDAGRKILKLLAEKEWILKAIINTHSNADHIGANNYLQGMTDCEIWATRGESAFIETPLLESSLLWGGFPYLELRSKFFEAKPSRVTRVLDPTTGTDGHFTFLPLPGHYVDMVGVLTKDGVFYLGDSVFGENILEKYKIPFIYDVQAFKTSLDRIASTEALYYVPSHGEACASVKSLIGANREKVEEVEMKLVRILEKPAAFEEILAELCADFGITLDYGQYVLVGSTLRSFLSYLRNEGKAGFSFENNKMLWTADRR
jgi:glyoxylase-like metal-dependent hydrolase (beta-lactamase superfamily II)